MRYYSCFRIVTFDIYSRVINIFYASKYACLYGEMFASADPSGRVGRFSCQIGPLHNRYVGFMETQSVKVSVECCQSRGKWILLYL
jgi:hypothetical protein